jgi:DNA sulfur modification protein DndC
VNHITDLAARSVLAIRQTLIQHPEPWVIGFSGGKDSSCVVKLVYWALLNLPQRESEVTILYCDTGVEIPPVRTFVWQTLTGLAIEAKKDGIPLNCQIAAPSLNDRFFFKIIGRGYVPPTNKFRWCTDRLRIQPVQSFLKKTIGERKLVVLGLRKGESTERDKTIAKHQTDKTSFSLQSGFAKTTIYSPILEYSVDDVWSVLSLNSPPTSIDSNRLLRLYRHANGECPMIRSPDSSPCAGSRFGCWTCTVVRRDKAMEGLIDAGYDVLRPLLNFRNWLAGIREDSDLRWRTRRNGAPGRGPFTVKARRTILRRLLAVQRTVGFQLITDQEIVAIRHEWKADQLLEKEHPA